MATLTDAAAVLRGDLLPAELVGFEHSPNPGRVVRRIGSPPLESLLESFRTKKLSSKVL